MSKDTSGAAERAAEAFEEGQKKRDRELGPAGLRAQADGIDDGTAMGGMMARIIRDRARDLEAELRAEADQGE